MILRGPFLPELLRAETLADLLESTAQRIPDHPAIYWQSEVLSYSELNRRADLAAHHLIQFGVKAGQIVGLCLPRGAALLIMQAAIAKAGAAWLPFEADTPVDRMQVCLEDAAALLLVGDGDLAGVGVPVLSSAQLSVPLAGDLLRRQGLLPSHPAYVIYTSGSTGKPKGVPIRQGSICHFLRSENSVLGVRQDDKVYQGFSVAFDMSFEEIWISYLVGASLWLAPKILTGDPDALPAILNQEKVTVLHAVPTLLALFSQEVPSLRIINLGGEMCPESLVERWATPERQVFNTYGPTECTVSASLAQLRRGEPVTIGKPLPNYGLLVRSEDGCLLPQGETGELCIIGPGVADGYLGRPDLTAEKFFDNPFSNLEEFPHEIRLYRTGDLARIDEAGQVQCLGRTDDQVKVRGFRVELGEIEASLCQIAGVGTAAVLLRELAGIDQLVAFVVAETSDAAALKNELKRSLPPYMIPARFEFMSELPRLTSGKIDRKTLKTRELIVPTGKNMESDEPVSDAEKALFAALCTLFPGQALRLVDDFFGELGGHSLLAARLVSILRRNPAYAGMTVQEIYQSRTLQVIATRLDALAHSQPEQVEIEPIRKVPFLRRLLCGSAQLATLPFLIGLRMLLWLAPFFTYHFMTGEEGDSLGLAVGVSILVYLGSLLFSFAIAITGKWLILGRLKAGRYRLYGLMYFRWWLADRLSDITPLYFLTGSPLQSLYLRALGASVGKNVSLSAISVRAYDLLSIGDGASIGASVNFENFRVDADHWEVGPISIGKDAYIGSYTVLQSDTHVADLGRLEGLSALSRGQKIAAAEVWNGSPARLSTDSVPDVPARPVRHSFLRGLNGLAYAGGSALVAILFFVPVFPSFLLIDWLDAHWFDLTEQGVALPEAFMFYLMLALPASAVLIILTLLGSAAVRWLLLPRNPLGSWPVFGAMYYRRWLTNQIQESSLNILHGLYASVYAGWWYRLLGAKVGRGTEISNAIGVVPDLLTLGEDSFIADAVMLGDEEIDRGWMTLRATVVGNRSFVGNGAYVPDGSIIPDDVLIGVQSRAPANDRMRSGQTWLGSPALSLPAREQVSGFADSLTFRPSLARRLARGFVEALRTVMPLAVIITVGYLTVLKVMPFAEREDFHGVFWALMMAGVLYGVGSFVFILVLKWLMIGRYRPHSAPMWTSFVWRSEALTSLYESIAVPNFFNFLRGTPWLPMAFRCMGCKIGSGVFMDTTDITEFDCVSIGDDTVMHAWSGPQTHLFEDRIMKIGRVEIGSGVNVGPRSTILYDAVVGNGARLGPLTLVVKGETIPEGQAWTGSPAVPWRTCRS
ncbi:Pls/PosA family non-ribosomal peptide synthetase [Janthinobacterium sp. B9-8]|uniref:Pls/PosA family non-ribosomal peptide synthetase n=1 Tax=Janthinobacterium sp. B9-8 TaxID=1236179 RepID=UPI00061D3772|nr:Pls/PosA family non-ribosomal peptide synthetase [Janthinobacterium sp. B9-8]AMC33237.1 peptide synthetase [Janthinobacterium sp. B9-8]